MSEIKKQDGCCGSNCGCDHNHDHGCDHHHEETIPTVHLELEDGSELECPVIDIFEVSGKEFIALLHPEDEMALLYGFKDYEDGSIELLEIESDDEYEKVSEVFSSLMDESLEQ